MLYAATCLCFLYFMHRYHSSTRNPTTPEKIVSVVTVSIKATLATLSTASASHVTTTPTSGQAPVMAVSTTNSALSMPTASSSPQNSSRFQLAWLSTFYQANLWKCMTGWWTTWPYMTNWNQCRVHCWMSPLQVLLGLDFKTYQVSSHGCSVLSPICLWELGTITEILVRGNFGPVDNNYW